MAKKPQVPRPPKPVQAPRQRIDSSSRSLPVSPAWIGAAVAVIAAIVIIVIATGGSSSSTNDAAVAKAMSAAGCTFKSVPPLPARKDPLNYHSDVPKLTTPMNGLWSTFPPSGGAHYGLWAVWGFYRQAVNPRQVVHNMEHGGVIIWWGPKVKSSVVDQLAQFYDQQQTGVVGTPLVAKIDGKSLGDKIALTAWTGDPTKYYRKVNGKYYYGMGHVAICSSFNQKAFATFRDAYRGKGPEGIPLSQDTPGSGPQ